MTREQKAQLRQSELKTAIAVELDKEPEEGLWDRLNREEGRSGAAGCIDH